MSGVIFDLDGTISDPAEGITGAINHTLDQLGFLKHPVEELLCFIGPPLIETFSKLTGEENPSFLENAVQIYRDYYTKIGFKENKLYSGIPELLGELELRGTQLYIATNKRKDIAEQVLEHLQIDHFFRQVHGCDIQHTKTELLQRILEENQLKKQPIVMIGDRSSDFHAAAEVNIPSIAVRWGYGTEEEFTQATQTVDVPEELLSVIQEMIWNSP